MNSYTCEYCNKKYVRKNAFNNHVLICKFQRISNDYKLFDSEESGANSINIQTININMNSMFRLLMHLHNKYEKLETDYNELKKYVAVTKNKINIIDYLNENYCCNSFDFNDFINYIEITKKDLEIVFKQDYVNGVLEILKDKINNIYCDRRESYCNQILPIKAFSNKDNILYIYLKESKESKGEWIIMDNNYLTNFIKHIDKQLLPLFLKWKEYNEVNMDYEQFSHINIIYMKKVLGSNFQKQDRKIMLKNKLYKNLKVDLKNIVKYEFL
jgi:hypothetical protein